jgi:hypothetical protein
LASLVTVAGDPAPAQTSEFAAFGRELRAPFMGDVFESIEWLSPAMTTRSTANRWRHYENMKLPEGLLAIGDAMCAFNPVFGQGLSVAAMQAKTLSRHLRAHGPDDGRLTERVVPACADMVRFPWKLATNQDLEIPGARGRSSLLQPAFGAFLERVMALAPHDPAVSLLSARVFHLQASALRLCDPRLLYRVLRSPAPVSLPGPVPPPPYMPVPLLEPEPEPEAPQGNVFASRATYSRRTSSPPSPPR